MNDAPPTPSVDLSECEREPIHVPGSIQPHGVLLALAEPGLGVAQASANAGELFGHPDVLGATPERLFGDAQGAALRAALANPSLERSPLYLQTVSVETAGGRRSFHAVAHRHDGALILELEPAASAEPVGFRDLYPLVRAFVARAEGVPGVEALARLAAEEVRRITGFDRALIYRFDEEWHGEVVAEDRDEELPAYLGLRFPASDIPRQARELYHLNHLRLIADSEYAAVPLVPALRPDTGRPLDLSFAALRSVSQIHCEYLRNMGVAASMSISVLREGRLWGLISCHHRTARVVPFEVRTACDFLGQVFALQLSAQEHRRDQEQRIYLKGVQARLLAYMAAEDDYTRGLADHPDELLGFAAAGGAAVLSEGGCLLVGRTPGDARVRRLAEWLGGRGEVFHTDELGEVFPEAADYREEASGLLAVSLSKLHPSYLMWFRPEVIQTVTWGGDPRRPAEPGECGGARLHPRRSFEAWKETVRGRSLPWRPAEAATAAELRNDIVGIVLRKAEEMAALTAELERSNRELEAFSYSVSHDLRAPFRHIVGYGELLKELLSPEQTEARRCLDNMIESGTLAGTLVDSLLNFSRLVREALHPVGIDLVQLAEEVRADVTTSEAGGRRIAWRIGQLPHVHGDLVLIRQVLRNLVSNAVKFTRRREDAQVTVGATSTDTEDVIHVRDNGVGFDAKYAGKLFGVFQRLHRVEDFEGTGIGLALTRRIIARHGGRTWAEGSPGVGATFYFSLPREPQP